MAMQEFTGWQYLLIDLANAFGHDKEVFEKRIAWAEENMDVLETLVDQADSKPLYVKAVSSIRKTQAGIPSGHLVGFDATCSGIQVMSAITGCITGANSVGLVDPFVRADAYTLCTKIMNEILAGQGLSVKVDRKQAKAALMTAFYGSVKEPEKLFGKDTPELEAFYKAAAIIAPGGWELLHDLLNSWQNGALEHAWQLPDGFNARVKVMKQYKDIPIEVDELDHATFSYTYYVNEGKVRGKDEGTKSNAANVVHSIDAYVLRSIHRRCNYDRAVVEQAHSLMFREQHRREMDGGLIEPVRQGTHMWYYMALYERSKMPDVVILPYINAKTVQCMDDDHMVKLLEITSQMLAHKPFPVITIHDEFKCHPNNMNHLRKHYMSIFAQLSEADLLSGIFQDIYGMPHITFDKKSEGQLGDLIRQSNYSLC